MYIAAVFLLPTVLAQGSRLVKLDHFFSFLVLRFKLYTKGLSPFFLLKPFLTVGVGMKVCLVSLVSSEFFDKFNISLSCSLRGVVSLGESTGTS